MKLTIIELANRLDVTIPDFITDLESLDLDSIFLDSE